MVFNEELENRKLRVASRSFAKISAPVGVASVSLPDWVDERNSTLNRSFNGTRDVFENPSVIGDQVDPGSSPDHPVFKIPVSGWRWEVANWPIDRWIRWRRRVDALLTPGANAEEIQAADRRAYDEETIFRMVAR